MGRIDRTQDLRRSVERIAAYCEEEQVDVLLIAGDLFSELSRPDNLRESIEHLQTVFAPFLMRQGTILALTGNHDNETFCQTLHSVMHLAAPASAEPGDVRPAGRLYLATEPSFLSLQAPAGFLVQFFLLPYPTPTRYLRDHQIARYGSLEEKNRNLQSAYAQKVRDFRNHPRFNRAAPAILSAHIHVQGFELPTLFRISEQESIIFTEDDLPRDFTYVALGHIHQAGPLFGQNHIRYSGSIERLDLGERNDQKSVTLFEVGPEGIRGEPWTRPLDATPMYDLEIFSPADELPHLRELYPDAERALVRYHLNYDAARDNLHEILNQLDQIFPRWYQRDWREISQLDGSLADPGAPRLPRSFHDTVMDYVTEELSHHEETERTALLQLVEQLLQEETS